MLQIVSVIKPKNSEAWTQEHIVNIVYTAIDNDTETNDVLNALHASQFSDSTRYVDGARLETLAKALYTTAKDENGNEKKVSCFVSDDWGKTLENVNNVLQGVKDPTAYAFSIAASTLMEDEKVVALVSKQGIEIPNVPCIGHGRTEAEAQAKAVERQRARWRLRVEKGNATIKYAKPTTTTPDTME